MAKITTTNYTIGAVSGQERMKITVTPETMAEKNCLVRLSYEFGGVTGEISDKLRDGYVWQWVPPEELAAEIPNAKSGKLTITATFGKAGGAVLTTVSTTVTLTVIADLVRPVITQNTVYDVNEATLALTGDSHRFINGYSKAQATLKAETRQGAEFVAGSIMHDGVYKIPVPLGGAYVDCTEPFEPTQGARFEYSVTDSRGYTTSVIVNHTEVAYTGVTCSISPDIPQPDGTMAFKVQGAFWNQSFGAKDNALGVFYRTKAGEGEWGEWLQLDAANVTADETSYTAQASIKVDYTQKVAIQAKAVDLLTEAESEEKTVRAFPVFYWGENDFIFNVPVFMRNNDYIYGIDADGEAKRAFCARSANGNTVINYDGYLDEKGNTNIYGNGVSLYTKGNRILTNRPVRSHFRTNSCSSATNLGTSAKKIPMGTTQNYSTALTETSDGGIKCNIDGVVLVAATLYVSGLTAGNAVMAAVYKNSTAYGLHAFQSGARTFLTCPLQTRAIVVNAGDIIYLYAYNYTEASGNVAANIRSQLTVMYI